MKIGILDIINGHAYSLPHKLFSSLFLKQFVSIMPQVISVWCRQAGHDTFYATYYGIGTLQSLLPDDLDIVFIACSTPLSHLAYVLAKHYKKAGIRTIIGGPHAKSFPVDCLRFFDVVVKECDRELLYDILSGDIPPKSYISTSRLFRDVPLVEERLPEIRKASFFQKRWPFLATVVPMLTSMGCAYQCDFCSDWDTPYRVLSLERLGADLQYINNHLPKTLIGFHDPNFGINFDAVMQSVGAISSQTRVPYVISSSLSTLNEKRMKWLKATNCAVCMPGVDSWTEYAAKSAAGRTSGEEKVTCVVEHLRLLYEYVPYINVNLLVGLDTDRGELPFRLTKQFLQNAPFVWPIINMPAPFGGTPRFEELHTNDRILKTMPFGLYYTPYLAVMMKHYEPMTFYEYLCDLYRFQISPWLVRLQNESLPDWRMRMMNRIRRIEVRRVIGCYERILHQLRTDRRFRAFHEGKSHVLPDFYQEEYRKYFGVYSELLTLEERVPNLEQIMPITH